jgi:hypothetical protein
MWKKIIPKKCPNHGQSAQFVKKYFEMVKALVNIGLNVEMKRWRHTNANFAHNRSKAMEHLFVMLDISIEMQYDKIGLNVKNANSILLPRHLYLFIQNLLVPFVSIATKC